MSLNELADGPRHTTCPSDWHLSHFASALNARFVALLPCSCTARNIRITCHAMLHTWALCSNCSTYVVFCVDSTGCPYCGCGSLRLVCCIYGPEIGSGVLNKHETRMVCHSGCEHMNLSRLDHNRDTRQVAQLDVCMLAMAVLAEKQQQQQQRQTVQLLALFCTAKLTLCTPIMVQRAGLT